MEEAIRDSMADQPPDEARDGAGTAPEVRLPPPGGAAGPASTTSPRTEALLKEVEEITLILVAVYM
eukprot:13699914-Alexandrium_andersonii.AAC.1